ncbi:MAG: hypothetical protein HYT79_07355 [Elusimicrobia bacterium]|nr:hypothetical protein [Elusimicrobiota bacterium]
MNKKEIIKLIREHHKSYTLDDIRKSLIENGQSPQDADVLINEALFSKPWQGKGKWIAAAAVVAAIVLFFALRPAKQKIAPGQTSAKIPLLMEEPLTAEVLSKLRGPRDRYRENYFDPKAHMELAKSLFNAGLEVDAFYVLDGARRLFPKRAASAAFGAVITDEEEARWRKAWPFNTHPQKVVEELNAKRDQLLAPVKTPEDLIPFLRSRNGAIRAEACIRAGKMKDRSLIEPLIERLDDDLGNVSQNADVALYQIAKTHQKAMQRYRDRVRYSDRIFTRGKYLNVYLPVFPKKTIIQDALNMLNDPAAYVRFAAFIFLSQIEQSEKNAQEGVSRFLEKEKDQNLLAVLETGGLQK